MSDTTTLDFQQILAQPTSAYEEGLRFFRGVGLMNETLRQLVKDLDDRKIDYSVIEAVALNQHGYQHFTQDIDLLMTKEGLKKLLARKSRGPVSPVGANLRVRPGQTRRFAPTFSPPLFRANKKFTQEIIGRGYRPAFEGATKKFRATSQNVPIEVITTGEYPGDGKPKPVVFPDPAESSVEIDGIKIITLEKLVELKLASGMTGVGRLKDLADVQELIKVRGLDASFAERLDRSVQAKYQELREGLTQSLDQTLAPDWDPEIDL